MTTEPLPTGKGRQWIRDLAEGAQVTGCYLVLDKRTGQTRSQKPFMSLTLGDRTGQVEAKVWDGVEGLAARFTKGSVIHVTGRVESYQGRVQLNVTGLDTPSGEVDPEWFLESAVRDPAEMLQALRGLLREVADPDLRELIKQFMNDREFISALKRAPAAKSFHHSYLGGLLEHTLSVCQMAKRVADQYPRLDKDLLLTGGFLHDIGKIRELTASSGIDYTDEGRLVGHLVQGVSMVEEKLAGLKGFPRERAVRLKHLILSHHGQYEFGSPKRPKFLEAFALNFVDDLDAKLAGLDRFMESDRQEGSWTEYHRLFERFFLKGDLRATDEEPEEVSRGAADDQGSLFRKPGP